MSTLLRRGWRRTVGFHTQSLIFTAIVLICLTGTFQQLSACDVCGCSAGNYFLGPMPQFNSHFVGLRYSFRSFNTVLKTDNSQFSNDVYQTAELWSGLKIRKRFQLLAFAPYNVNRSTSDDGVRELHGFGDVSVIGSYRLFDHRSLTGNNMTVGQQLWVGAGVKLPTGHFELDTSELVASANNQAGTGSLDIILTTSYLIALDNWSFIGNLSYKINQAASDFKFGNRVTLSSFISRAYYLKRITLRPNIGMFCEYLSPNTFQQSDVASTGGHALLGTAGLETSMGKITLGFNLQFPLSQNISDDQTHIRLRGMAHVTYVF